MFPNPPGQTLSGIAPAWVVGAARVVALFLGSRDKKIFHAAHPVYRADLSAGAPRKRAKETSPYLGFVCAARGVSPTR